MPILQTISLSEPKGVEKIPGPALVYFRARLKQRIFSAIIKEYKRSGLSKADLSRRLDKEPAQVSRLLSGPGNVTLETVSDILFALSGSELGISVERPFGRVLDNVSYTRPSSPITGTPKLAPQIKIISKNPDIQVAVP